jgi:hypothetical protein
VDAVIVLHPMRWRDVPFWVWALCVAPWWARLTRPAARETDHPARLG